VRAATQDREMVGALGVNQRLLFTSGLRLGSMLAGLGGALQLPREAVNLQMDLADHLSRPSWSSWSAAWAASRAPSSPLLIGDPARLRHPDLPQITLVLAFLVMAVVLVIRPHGLLGAPISGRAAWPDRAALLPPPRSGLLRPARGAGCWPLVPPFLGDYDADPV
jgi:branched-chain amino acid transport system permease protein